jgi:hypothetical protein
MWGIKITERKQEEKKLNKGACERKCQETINTIKKGKGKNKNKN